MATRARLFQLVNEQMKRRKPSPQMREAAKKKSWGIIKGDKVQVIGNHPEKGKQGIVKAVLRHKDRVIVEGVNMGPKFLRGDAELGTRTQIIQQERTIHYSKVNLVDPETRKPTRFYRKYLEDGTQVRVSKKSGAIIPKPPFVDDTPISSHVSDKDTPDEDVWEQTYFPKSSN